jgi:hypothetical protein
MEHLMERRAFLRLMFAGAGAAAVVASSPTQALTSLAPLAPPAAPEDAVARPADMEQAKVENSYWVYRRRYYWRPRRRYWRRRYWRRYYRPRFRRRYYYYY